VFGFPIERVTVEKGDRWDGAIWLTNPEVTRDDLPRGIIYALAGQAAERHLLGTKKIGGFAGDLEKAAEGIKELKEHAHVTKRAVPSIRELVVGADALVRKYRKPITDLAALLMACGTLDGLTVHQVLQSAIDPQSSPIAQPIAKRSLSERLAPISDPLFEPRATGHLACRRLPGSQGRVTDIREPIAKRLHTSTDLFAKYRPDQRRDDRGRFADEGKGGADGNAVGGGGWQRAARLAGMAAFGIAAVGGAAVAVRTGNASAALHLATHGRSMMAAAARIKGGSKVSRSLLEASAYNLSHVRASLGLLPYQHELARRFQGMTTAAYFGRDTGTGLSGIIISVRSGTVTREAVAAGRVPANVFLGEALLAETALMGRVLFVGNLYAPATSAGALFSREYMNTLMRTAIANRVDHIRTFAGSSMGGYLWPQRGFELASPTSELAQALRRTIATRAGQMLDGNAITRSQYDAIVTVAAKWSKDTPTQIAHMNTKVAVGGLKLKDFPDLNAVRGDMTIGKALLAGTQSFYVLPRAKYESFLTITKRGTVAERLAGLSPPIL
jgi:hypothetical protein